MDICLAIDNNYIPQAAVFLGSVIRNTKEECIFHVLTSGVAAENCSALSAYAVSLGAKVCFYDLGDFEEKAAKYLGEKPRTGKFASVVLARIFAPEYLPREVEKYLYCDSDMLCLKDLKELYSTELKGFVCAMCEEPTIYEELTVPQGRTGLPEKMYFNSGLMLIDRNAWEENSTTEKCMAWFKENNGKAGFADQDTINNVLAGKIKPLAPKFNFFSNYRYQRYKELSKRAPWFKETVSEESFNEAKKHPVIIHYAGDERPWIRGNRNPYRKEYLKELSRTPWKDTPLVKGKEAYMAFYHAVNVLSYMIPGFRTFTSYVYRKTKGRVK